MLRKLFTLLSMAIATTAWSAPPPAEMPGSESQRYAHDRLFEMAKFLGATPRFSASMNISYDAVQEDGQKIEFAESREIAVERPRRVRVTETSSDGGRSLLLFDGERITVSSEAGKLFAQVEQPGDIDDSVIYYMRDLKMRLPLAPVLMATLDKELQRRLTSIDYVERTLIDGKPVHHIAGRTAKADFQVWIADGKQPLPRRIVMTYKNEPGQPQFRADFDKWNLSPRFGKTTFKFQPAADARQIVFAVQVVPVVVAADAAGNASKGEQK